LISTQSNLSLSATNRVDLSNQELASLLRVTAIAEMRKQDSRCEVTVTNGVANGPTAKDLELVTGEVGDLLVVTASLGVAKGNNTSDLVLDTGGKILDSTVVDGCTLTVVMISL
jgi:hypothetical protein